MEVYLQAGQHNAALKQYQTCEQLLRRQLNLDPQPETRALFKKIRKRDMKPVQPEKLTETVAPKHNLPSQLSSFIGREKEQEEIINILTKNRLVTLAGVGGIGKTRLALQVGQKLLPDYANGIWFIPLDSLSDPMLVPQTVALVFDIQETVDRSLIEKLTGFLHDKTTLLILDNCEHLLDACVQMVTTLLQKCLNIRILVTSRATLNVAGEAIYYLPSLLVPEQEVRVEKYPEYESVRLFTDRAALALSSFSLSTENVSAVVEICRKVDGIPLAIELAAARVNIMQVEEILKQLQQSFVFLASDNQNILPRQQTLQASMDWSWGLLAESEQIFLCQLSVFTGGWTLDSAEAVCDGDVLTLTSALVKKSLIMVEQESGRETRYGFHEIVRQYVHGKLVGTNIEKIYSRHLKYFLRLAERATAEFVDPTWRWISRLNDERDNIRAALKWANQTDVEAGLYLSGRLRRYWESSNVREGIQWLETFENKPESKNFPLARAYALHTLGWLVTWLQQFDKARSVTEESLALFRVAADLRGEADALVSLANIEQFFDKHDAAAALLQRSLDLSRSLNDPWREANAYCLLGWDPRDWPRRFKYWENAVLLYRQTGDQIALANVLGILGQFRVLNGDIELGEKYIDEALPLWESGRKANIWESPKVAKSSIALIRGEPEQAYILLEEARQSAKEKGNRMSYLWARVRLGYAALRSGRLEEARDLFVETARDFQKDRYIIGVVFTLEGMASLYVIVDKQELAALLIGWADSTREKVHDTRPPLEQADVDQIIAACLAKMGEVAFSEAYDEGQKMTLDEAVAYALNER
jgi:predicted ATPase